MGRLIDADAFIESLQEYIDKPITVGSVVTLVELFPTAYNVEKVVEEIRNQPFGNYGVQEENEIIDIVKRGGVKCIK